MVAFELLISLQASCSSAWGPGARAWRFLAQAHPRPALASPDTLPQAPRPALGPSGMQAPWLWGAAWRLASCYKKLWCRLPTVAQDPVASKGQPPGASASHLRTGPATQAPASPRGGSALAPRGQRHFLVRAHLPQPYPEARRSWALAGPETCPGGPSSGAAAKLALETPGRCALDWPERGRPRGGLGREQGSREGPLGGVLSEPAKPVPRCGEGGRLPPWRQGQGAEGSLLGWNACALARPGSKTALAPGGVTLAITHPEAPRAQRALSWLLPIRSDAVPFCVPRVIRGWAGLLPWGGEVGSAQPCGQWLAGFCQTSNLGAVASPALLWSPQCSLN